MDAASALQKARAAIKTAEAAIAKLRTDRVDAMLGPEEAIVQIDDKILAAQKAVGLQLERVKAFVGELRRQRHAERLKEREKFLAGKAQQLEQRNRLFEQFEKDWLKAGASYRAAMAARADYLRNWRDDLCRLPGDYDLRSAFVEQAVMSDIVDFKNPDHIGTRTKGIAKKVADGAAAHFERLSASSLPPDDVDIENEKDAA